MAAIGISCFVYLLSTSIFGDDGTLRAKKDKQNPVQISDITDLNYGSNRDRIKTASVRPDDLKEVNPRPVETTYLPSKTMSIVGKLFDEYVIEIGMPPNTVQKTTGELFQAGIELEIISDCQIKMTYGEVDYIVRCPLHIRHFPAPKDNRGVTVDVKPFGAFTDRNADGSKRAMASGAASGGM